MEPTGSVNATAEVPPWSLEVLYDAAKAAPAVVRETADLPTSHPMPWPLSARTLLRIPSGVAKLAWVGNLEYPRRQSQRSSAGRPIGTSSLTTWKSTRDGYEKCSKCWRKSSPHKRTTRAMRQLSTRTRFCDTRTARRLKSAHCRTDRRRRDDSALPNCGSGPRDDDPRSDLRQPRHVRR